MGISQRILRPTFVTAAIAALILTAGCAPSGAAEPAVGAAESGARASTPEGTRAMLDGLGLDSADPAALATGLDALAVDSRTAEFSAAIMPGEIRVQPDQPGELVIPVPEDQFYLSVAPYRTQTHPCTFHVPTSCLGELRSVDAQLRVTDLATGDVVVDRAVRTEDNGFVGVWLPRDGDFTVEMTVDGDTGSQVVRTGANDPTCLTTLQLNA